MATPRGYYCSSETTDNAFSGDDKKKSRGDLMFERNTHKKQARELKVERDALIVAYEGEKTKALATLKGLVASTKGHASVKDALWGWYDDNKTCVRVFTEKAGGEKTHKGRASVKRGTGKEAKMEEIDAHLTPEGDYYKPWGEKDEPCYFLKPLAVTRANFTIDNKGDLVPIKRY